jgi:hypothetical protein
LGALISKIEQFFQIDFTIADKLARGLAKTGQSGKRRIQTDCSARAFGRFARLGSIEKTADGR